MRRSRSAPVLLALLLSVFVVAGCGDDGTISTGSSGAKTTATEAPAQLQTASDAANPGEVRIADFKYLPETITVKVGDTVSWKNEDKAPHTSTGEDKDAFDTGNLEQGDTGKVKFDKAGDYPYVCEFHAFMKGTVKVQ